MTKNAFTLGIFTSFAVLIWLFTQNQVFDQLGEIWSSHQAPTSERLQEDKAPLADAFESEDSLEDVFKSKAPFESSPDVSDGSDLASPQPSDEEVRAALDLLQPSPTLEEPTVGGGYWAPVEVAPPVPSVGSRGLVASADLSSRESIQNDTDPLRESSMERSTLALATEDYNIWRLEHNKALLQWQLAQSNILFAIVLFVVIIGLWFSYIQFKKGDKLEGNLKFGTSGIEVTSSILGVLILGFSVGFLYLYLVHAYPVRGIGQSMPLSETTSSNSDPE